MEKLYKGFTKEEHVEVYQMMESIRKQIWDLNDKIVRAYGITSSINKEAHKLRDMTKLKQALENAYAHEHGSIKDSPY